MDIVNREDIPAYRTKDGSLVREIVHPDRVPVRNLSLAEAALEPSASTALHYHEVSEEVYYVTAGRGLLSVADEETEIRAGQAVLIPRRARHRVVNIGDEELVFLCVSSPPYGHQDTEIEEDEE
ncbi:MAG: cupin domain-containing protein [Armatimonadota bacterium]|nr:MAG: cupin domain-containing protein [Armatimonadota bacterium]